MNQTALDNLIARMQRAERQRDRLADALRTIQRRVPVMASTGEYRDGQIHALEACREVASAALAGFGSVSYQDPAVCAEYLRLERQRIEDEKRTLAALQNIGAGI